MKRILTFFALMCIAGSAFAIDFNAEARTDITYTSFIKNEAFAALSMVMTPTAIDAYEKLRLKAVHAADGFKFNFDGRLYIYPDKADIDYVIDSAYVALENGPFVFYAGKQRIKWGTGYFWNPSDNLQAAKNIFRTTEDLEGIYALRAEFSNGIVTPSVIIIPKIVPESLSWDRNAAAAVQLYSLLGTCDVFLNYVYDGGRSDFGGAVSWDAGLAVVNAEAGMKRVASGDSFMLAGERYAASFCAGLNRTITDEISAAVEYYYNGNGTALRSGSVPVPVTPMSQRNYLAYTASYVWDQAVNISLTGLHGLDDGTCYLFPSVAFVENQNFDIQLSVLENLTAPGYNEGRYAAPIYSTVELRINGYF